MLFNLGMGTDPTLDPAQVLGLCLGHPFCDVGLDPGRTWTLTKPDPFSSLFSSCGHHSMMLIFLNFVLWKTGIASSEHFLGHMFVWGVQEIV